MNKRLSRSGIIKLWIVQLTILCLAGLLSLLVYGHSIAVSVLLGGLVCFIPNVYFAMTLFKYQGARNARNIVNSFYMGEALKLTMTAGLFALVFMVFEVKAAAFFASFILMQLTHWLSPWIFVFKQNRPESD